MEFSKLNESMISVTSVTATTYSIGALLARKKRLETRLADTQKEIDKVDHLIAEAAKLGVVEKPKGEEIVEDK